MVVLRRKKNSRLRADTTHGYGSMKKNRGAGHRGGRGMAGSGKRADTKKPTILKLFGNSYFGRRGFKVPGSVSHVCMNLDYLDARLDAYVAAQLVTKEGDVYVVDLVTLGYTKLLGRGQIRSKIKLTAPALSTVAKQKIEKAGGSVVSHEAS